LKKNGLQPRDVMMQLGHGVVYLQDEDDYFEDEDDYFDDELYYL